MIDRGRTAAVAGLVLGAALWTAPVDAVRLDEVPGLRTFVDEMAARHGFRRSELVRWFTRARIRYDVIAAMDRPAEALPWYRYRRRFVRRRYVRRGVRYWRTHASVLARAEARYGVPPEIVVALLGVESRYGELTGRYPVLDTLTTLAFHYPRRRAFFRRELEQYLLLAREEGFDPRAMKGSYAGAMGKPQFIASSYRRYAVDFDGDDRRDLMQSNADIIGSVAHYLARHGWRRGGAVMAEAIVHRAPPAKWTRAVRPRLALAQLARAGIVPRRPVPGEARAALIRLAGRRGAIYRLGFYNFYVITRYNRSVNYAMAVAELAERIRSAAGDRLS